MPNEDDNDPENLPKKDNNQNFSVNRVDESEVGNMNVTADVDNSTTQFANSNNFKKYKQF